MYIRARRATQLECYFTMISRTRSKQKQYFVSFTTPETTGSYPGKLVGLIIIYASVLGSHYFDAFRYSIVWTRPDVLQTPKLRAHFLRQKLF